MFPNPPGSCRLEPYSAGLRERIWWGSGSTATSIWAAKLGMNLQSSTLKDDETGEPLHVQQRKQIEAFRDAWAEAGHQRQPRVSVSRSIFALTTDLDRYYFGRDRNSTDQIGMIDENTWAIFGRSYAAEPDILVKELAQDEAIEAADTLLLTIPSQLGVEYNAHLLADLLNYVAPELGWRYVRHSAAPGPVGARRGHLSLLMQPRSVVFPCDQVAVWPVWKIGHPISVRHSSASEVSCGPTT